MFGGKGGLGGLMKQAQQMQGKMQKMQEEIAQLEVTGESGAGLVKVTINGAHNCRRVEIDQACSKTTKRCWKIWLQPRSTMPLAVSTKPRKKWPLYPAVCNCRRASRCRSDANQSAAHAVNGSVALPAGRRPVGAAYGVTLLQRDRSGGMRSRRL